MQQIGERRFEAMEQVKLSDRCYRAKQEIFQRLPFVEAIFAFNRYRREKWVAQEARQIPARARVLDVGAGSCPHRHLFRHCEYITQDLAMLEANQLQGRGGYGHIDIISEISAIPIANESFDVVLCTEVIEHVPEPIFAVREMARVLRSGGTLLLTAPLRSGLHQEPYHFYGGYTPYWYNRFLSEAGFAEIQTTPVGGLLNAYNEEGLRVAIALSPGLIDGFHWKRLLLLPIWILMLVWIVIVTPFFYVLDSFLFVGSLTVGYHVRARKK